LQQKHSQQQGEQRAAGYYRETRDNEELHDQNLSIIGSKHSTVQTTVESLCCAYFAANCLASSRQQIGTYSSDCSIAIGTLVAMRTPHVMIEM